MSHVKVKVRDTQKIYELIVSVKVHGQVDRADLSNDLASMICSS